MGGDAELVEAVGPEGLVHRDRDRDRRDAAGYGLVAGPGAAVMHDDRTPREKPVVRDEPANPVDVLRQLTVVEDARACCQDDPPRACLPKIWVDGRDC